MIQFESTTHQLRGIFRDIIRDPQGRITWDSQWRNNTIVVDGRRLLASLLHGGDGALGIQGLQVGAGNVNWDALPGPPPAQASQTALVDPNPHTVVGGDLQIDFLRDDGTTVANPTNRLQIVATLGPGFPAWPDVNHPTSTLREFGLVGQLNGSPVLINYVIHPAIVKDPASTLERTLWLTF